LVDGCLFVFFTNFCVHLQVLVQLEPEDAVATGAQNAARTMVRILTSAQFAQGLVRLWEDQAARDNSYEQWLSVPTSEQVRCAIGS